MACTVACSGAVLILFLYFWGLAVHSMQDEDPHQRISWLLLPTECVQLMRYPQIGALGPPSDIWPTLSQAWDSAVALVTQIDLCAGVSVLFRCCASVRCCKGTVPEALPS